MIAILHEDGPQVLWQANDSLYPFSSLQWWAIYSIHARKGGVFNFKNLPIFSNMWGKTIDIIIIARLFPPYKVYQSDECSYILLQWTVTSLESSKEKNVDFISTDMNMDASDDFKYSTRRQPQQASRPQIDVQSFNDDGSQVRHSLQVDNPRFD